MHPQTFVGRKSLIGEEMYSSFIDFSFVGIKR